MAGFLLSWLSPAGHSWIDCMFQLPNRPFSFSLGEHFFVRRLLNKGKRNNETNTKGKPRFLIGLKNRSRRMEHKVKAAAKVQQEACGIRTGGNKVKPVPAERSRTVKTSLVLPPDTNQHGTIFGGKVLAYIDEVAAIAAMRHSQKPIVTASFDSVDFLSPVKEGDTINIEAFVTWTGRTSMEVFAKVTSEKFPSGEERLTATSFVTMVALDENGKPAPVPPVEPHTEEERELYQTAPERQKRRKERKKNWGTGNG
jgi:acyl-CoA hydrolase